MAKAYDRVSWAFLGKFLRCLGFASSWVNLIMECICSAPYSVLINGERGADFFPSRWLKHGDPLSTFLFLFCTEDDALMFCRARDVEVFRIKSILDRYTALTGQLVNFDKSSLFFSPNTSVSQKEVCRRLLGIHNVDWPNKYLGLPSFWGRSKTVALNFLSEKVSAKASCLKGSLLSKAVLSASQKELPSLVQPAFEFLAMSLYCTNPSSPNILKIAALWNRRLCLMLRGSGRAFSLFSRVDPERVEMGYWGWSEDEMLLVDRFFNQRDRDLILNIPLSLFRREDHKVWGTSLNGRFSVKSAYHIACSLLHKVPSSLSETSSSFDAVSDLMWRNVWKIKAHQKITLFIWQSMHDRILVQSQLGIRGVPSSPDYPFCDSEVETIDHLLCTCAFAQLVWKLCPLRIVFSSPAPTMWKKRWFDLCDRWSQLGAFDDCTSLATFVCWSIWKCRNDLVFNRKRWNPFDVAQKAFTDFQEFQEVSRQNNLLSLPFCPVWLFPAVWSAPALECFKLNFDAAFNSSHQTCGGGVILQNHLGRPVKVATFFLSHSSLSLAETLVLRESLLLLNRWGYKDVVVEGDYKPVMQLQVTVEGQVLLVWIPLGGNGVAHFLSRKALAAKCGDLEWSIWHPWLLNALLPIYSSSTSMA
ncbi:uncharacterized protein LOC132295667 [Cornus florida]|uniref:uncharacterized protein LOC132295667 n=1 Tax=Cornus florida TaxID=4283 RepID=UPI00289D44AB|nr:uncharacterized protein LOC132295667 [Cornus florida]